MVFARIWIYSVIIGFEIIPIIVINDFPISALLTNKIVFVKPTQAEALVAQILTNLQNPWILVTGCFGKPKLALPADTKSFLSILSIRCGNWFYWADRAETAERAESKETRVFMRIWGYVA
jgi:hypothetical protein